jgi:hypothetical protein
MFKNTDDFVRWRTLTDGFAPVAGIGELHLVRMLPFNNRQ